MNTSRDPDRLITAFLREGAERLPDQVYDAVRAEIDTKRQRAFFGPWRFPAMHKLIPIGLGAAAVIAVLVVGSLLLRLPGSSVGASPTPATSAGTPGALLPAGRWTVVDNGRLPNTPGIFVKLPPTGGWTSLPGFGGISKGPDEASPPQSAMLFWAWPVGTGFDVYGDPCHWKSTRPSEPATTPDEIAAALARQASRPASAPEHVFHTDFTAVKVTLRVPGDFPASGEPFAACDDGIFASYGLAGAAPSRSHQGPGQIDEMWVTSVNGAVVIIDAMYAPGTPADVIDEMRVIAESATFAW